MESNQEANNKCYIFATAERLHVDFLLTKNLKTLSESYLILCSLLHRVYPYLQLAVSGMPLCSSSHTFADLEMLRTEIPH
jgi:hypothetical protein